MMADLNKKDIPGMKYVCAFLLVFSCVFSQGQYSVKFNKYDIEEVINEKNSGLVNEIISLVNSGKLKAYKDSLFKKTYSKKEWEKVDFFTTEVMVEVPDSLDPSTLLYTMVRAEFSQPVYQFIKLKNNYIHYYLDSARLFFINPVQLSVILDSGTKSFLGWYRKMIGDSIPTAGIEGKSGGLLKQYAVRLHELVMDNKIKAYKNDSLTSFYERGQELFEATGSTATNQYHNSDYTYVYDSVIVSPFEADSIQNFFAGFRVTQTSPFTYVSECVSVSPQKMQNYVDGRAIYPSRGPMYYISIRELKHHLSPDELYLLEEIITYLTREGHRR